MIKCIESTRPHWPSRELCSLSQVACWLVWQQHRLPTLIQYYPSSRTPWTWQKEVREVKPSYYTPQCSGPTTSPSNCPLMLTKHGPCHRMLKGHWHHSHLQVLVSGRKTRVRFSVFSFTAWSCPIGDAENRCWTTVLEAAKERARWCNWCSWVLKLLMDGHWKCAGRCDSPRTFPYCAHPQWGGTGLFFRLLPHPQLHSHLPRRQQMGRSEESVLAGAAGSHFGVDGEHIIQRFGWGDYKATHGPLLLNPAVGHLLRSALWNLVVLTAQVYTEIPWYISMAFLPLGDNTHLCWSRFWSKLLYM